MSERELVIEATVKASAQAANGTLCDAHFTDTDFYLTPSQLIPASDRKSFFYRRFRKVKRITYDQIRNVMIEPQGDGYFLVRITTGSPKQGWRRFVTKARINMSVSENAYKQMKELLSGKLQLTGRIQDLAGPVRFTRLQGLYLLGLWLVIEAIVVYVILGPAHDLLNQIANDIGPAGTDNPWRAAFVYSVFGVEFLGPLFTVLWLMRRLYQRKVAKMLLV